MPANSSKDRKARGIARPGRSRRTIRPGAFEVIPGKKPRMNMHANQYCCTIEKNQNGKYNVRVRARFGNGGSHGWTLPVYFLASSFNAAMKKLEESLQLLQKHEHKLRFWGVERSDDPNMAGDLLEEFGLWLDRRRDFPRKAGEIGVFRDRPVPAAMLAPLRRILADAVAQERLSAVAGD
jgi:hypothetical protein